MTRDARSTVEQSFVLSISSLRQAIRPGAYGWITWDWPNGAKSSVGLSVTQDADTPIITLQYRCRNQEDIRIPVRLQATSINSGGKRWWFTCPLIVDGVRCGRRANRQFPKKARACDCLPTTVFLLKCGSIQGKRPKNIGVFGATADPVVAGSSPVALAWVIGVGNRWWPASRNPRECGRRRSGGRRQPRCPDDACHAVEQAHVDVPDPC